MARKYILPEENTLDLALMFVPSESVYYELLQTKDAKGTPLDEYCRDKRIVAVSPNTLYAHLSVIAMGLRGMQIEENARRLANGLTGLQKRLDNFSELFEKVGTHLKNVQQSYNEADRRLDKTQAALTGMLEAGDAPADLPDAQQTLPLPAVSSAKSGS